MIKRVIKNLLSIILVFILVIVAINLYTVLLSSPYIYTMDEIEKIDNHTVTMALGAKVYSNGNLSYVLRDRVDYAIELYKSGKAKKIIFSGDHGTKEYDEVNAMFEYAQSKGIDKADIFLDHAGFSTYDSMYRAKEVFLCEDIIIITQSFHIYRSVYIARRIGLNAIGIKSNQHNYYLSTDIKNNMRECLARVKDFIYVEITRPKPKYLGSTIPIIGDGFLTHDK